MLPQKKKEIREVSQEPGVETTVSLHLWGLPPRGHSEGGNPKAEDDADPSSSTGAQSSHPCCSLREDGRLVPPTAEVKVRGQGKRRPSGSECGDQLRRDPGFTRPCLDCLPAQG